jgi:hypothetical protein
MTADTTPASTEAKNRSDIMSKRARSTPFQAVERAASVPHFHSGGDVGGLSYIYPEYQYTPIFSRILTYYLRFYVKNIHSKQIDLSQPSQPVLAASPRNGFNTGLPRHPPGWDTLPNPRHLFAVSRYIDSTFPYLRRTGYLADRPSRRAFALARLPAATLRVVWAWLRLLEPLSEEGLVARYGANQDRSTPASSLA